MRSKCFKCQRKFPLRETYTVCPKCGGPLIFSSLTDKNQFLESLKEYEQKLDRNEGETPLQELKPNLLAKREDKNPTGSFKDRGSVKEIAAALNFGYNSIVLASTGNMALSLAHYALQTDTECEVVVPDKTPSERLEQIREKASKVTTVSGDYDEAAKLAKRLAKEQNRFLAGDYLIRRVGMESLGRELAKDLFKANIKNTDIYIPVGNGTLFVAIYNGFNLANKNIKARFIGTQGKGADPIYRAWQGKKTLTPIQNPQTLGAYFKVGTPIDGELVLDCIRKNYGILLATKDSNLKEAKRDLKKNFSLNTCYTAASTYAAYKELPTPDKNSILVITGS